MFKTLLSAAGWMICAASVAFTATASDISGYFRVQNAASGKYVEVRGPFTAEADRTYAEAIGLAGTVLFVEGDWIQKGDEALIKVTSLRGQGIEVVGKPIENYLDVALDLYGIAVNANSNDDVKWGVARLGSQYGYTSLIRALLEAIIFEVAAQIDRNPNELSDFADRFNKEVADKIDLSILLEPYEGGYRVRFDTPDLTSVSEWYLANEENKALFEKGFLYVREYMLSKIGVTGEGFEPAEIAEMHSWGYDIPEKYLTEENDNGEGVYVIPYEDIFADPDLLFNWLKLNVIKITDVNRCPDMTIKDINLRSFAEMLQQNELTKQLVGYFPRLQTNQSIYLTDGKYENNFGHLDFTSHEGVVALGDNAKWTLHPVTDQDDSYLAFNWNGYDKEGYYASVYTDFPMQPADKERTKFYILSEETDFMTPNEKTYEYHELVEVDQTIRMQPVIIEMTGYDNPDGTNFVASNHRILPVYELTMNPAPEINQEVFGIGNDVIGSQRSPRLLDAEADTETTDEVYDHSEEPLKGVLLETVATTDALKSQWDIDYHIEDNPLHRLKTRYTATTQTPVLFYSTVKSGTTINANEAFIVKPNTDASELDDIDAIEDGFALKPLPEEMEEDLAEDIPTGVGTIVTDAPTRKDNVLYNLKGEVVKNPVPGNIYILNGKKIIIL